MQQYLYLMPFIKIILLTKLAKMTNRLYGCFNYVYCKAWHRLHVQLSFKPNLFVSILSYFPAPLYQLRTKIQNWSSTLIYLDSKSQSSLRFHLLMMENGLSENFGIQKCEFWRLVLNFVNTIRRQIDITTYQLLFFLSDALLCLFGDEFKLVWHG